MSLDLVAGKLSHPQMRVGRRLVCVTLRGLPLTDDFRRSGQTPQILLQGPQLLITDDPPVALRGGRQRRGRPAQRHRLVRPVADPLRLRTQPKRAKTRSAWSSPGSGPLAAVGTIHDLVRFRHGGSLP